MLRILSDITPVLDANGEPLMSSGNFGVVFKVKHQGGFKAIKCFTRFQKHRREAYTLIDERLLACSPYTISHRYLTDEIRVFEHNNSRTFDVLLMDWVEGETMTNFIIRALYNDNFDALKGLQNKFIDLAQWLLRQDFAHGDLKPDNIMVGETGELTLVDYDGVYLSELAHFGHRELGTPHYQHPLRGTELFSKDVDNYSVLLICATLDGLSRGDKQLSEVFLREHSIFLPENLVKGSDLVFNKIASGDVGFATRYKALGKSSQIERSELMKLLESFAPQSDDLEEAEDGFKVYWSEGKCGLVDCDNIVRIHAQYEAIKDFSEGRAAFRQEGKWGYLDRDGVVKIPPIYHSAEAFSHSRAAVSLEGRYGYIDRDGRTVGGLRFSGVFSFRDQCGLVCYRGKYGFVGLDGRMKISAKFDHAYSFSEGVACVGVQGRYGYIDKRGKWLIYPEFDYASNLRDGCVKIEVHGQLTHVEFDELITKYRNK